ncbi:MAG: dockerin type I repeat-containing protein, partial [candidate division Zixibacteria bacterium]|nr:dockerin type I repeat-containing protein [candidate division Zixibacteria bacterium]
KNAGGPDAYGYSWIDSDDAAGPVFDWVDISAVGVSVALADDGSTGPLGMGFSFPFYDSSYSDVYIGSNGVLSFGTGATSRTNQNLPIVTAPNNLIALWWDDLDPAEGGNIYYYYDSVNERFIVSFVEIRNYQNPDGTGSLSFQAILYPNGQIVLQYGTMDPGADADGFTSATVGLENVDGSDGLSVVYNAAYMHSDLAISFKAARWMSASPAGGSIESNSSAVVTINFDATDLANGEYGGQVTIVSNDPTQSSVTIPVSLAISSFVCGDANGSSTIDVADAVFIINYAFKGGPAPDPLASGDANGSASVDVADAVYIINYAFKGGPAPNCP